MFYQDPACLAREESYNRTEVLKMIQKPYEPGKVKQSRNRVNIEIHAMDAFGMDHVD